MAFEISEYLLSEATTYKTRKPITSRIPLFRDSFGLRYDTLNIKRVAIHPKSEF